MLLTGVGFLAVESFVPLLAIAVVGTLNPSSGDVSVFLPTEQAFLATHARGQARTRLYAMYNVGGNLAGALGALGHGGGDGTRRLRRLHRRGGRRDRRLRGPTEGSSTSRASREAAGPLSAGRRRAGCALQPRLGGRWARGARRCSCSGSTCASGWPGRRPARSSSRWRSSRRSRSCSRLDWPGASGSCGRWCSPTCRRTGSSCWPRSRPTPGSPSRCSCSAPRSPRWTCRRDKPW